MIILWTESIMFTYIRDVLVMSNAIMQFIEKVWLLIDKEEEAKLCKSYVKVAIIYYLLSSCSDLKLH